MACRRPFRGNGFFEDAAPARRFSPITRNNRSRHPVAAPPELALRNARRTRRERGLRHMKWRPAVNHQEAEMVLFGLVFLTITIVTTLYFT